MLDPAGGSPTSTMTYQGYLEDDGQPANGVYDFRVSVWDQEIGGTLLGSIIVYDTPGVTVQDGYFTIYFLPGVAVNQVFTGEARWLQLEVRPHNWGGYTILPRQPITNVPYAWSLRPGAVISGTPSTWDGWVVKVNMDGAYPVADAILGTTATGSAVAGQSPGGIGIYGHTENGYGVYGYDTGVDQARGYGGYFYSSNGIGIFGRSDALPNNPNAFAPGVYGYSTHGSGVYGLNLYDTLWTAAGVTGESTDGYGVRGRSTNSTGLQGSSANSHGVYGYTGSVYASGVVGLQTGYSTDDWLNWDPGGYFGGRNGVVGVTKADFGYGVAGRDISAGGGWAGYFTSHNGNGVYISAPTGQTGLNVAGGTKNAVVATDEGSKLLYSEESTEVWFTDYGFGQLEDGLAVITIDEVFAQTVNLDEPYHVFVQVYGDAEVYVSNRTATQFEVHLRDGDPAVEFSYRIVAKRLGYEDDRLEPAPWADGDPHLYPEKQDASSAQGGSK
ncbi:MAG: hypothetical protein JW918_09520 [Anaerolineae bacterium]|nr:hypothetical protein [Anaerolineae bacterium]